MGALGNVGVSRSSMGLVSRVRDAKGLGKVLSCVGLSRLLWLAGCERRRLVYVCVCASLFEGALLTLAEGTPQEKPPSWSLIL